MIYKLGTTWSDKEFDTIGWHDNLIDLVIFPTDDLVLKFKINHILEWIRPNSKDGVFFKFVVALAEIEFYNILNLTFRLDFEDRTAILIDEIVRENKRLSPNKKTYRWNYRIITDQGDITFDSTGFTQTLISNPKISDSIRYIDR
jgi:hypothetical protein